MQEDTFKFLKKCFAGARIRLVTAFDLKTEKEVNILRTSRVEKRTENLPKNIKTNKMEIEYCTLIVIFSCP